MKQWNTVAEQMSLIIIANLFNLKNKIEKH